MTRASTIRAHLTDVHKLLRQLGLDRGSVPQRQGLMISCPFHSPDRTPSCSVQLVDGTILYHCHACGAKGTALDLIAVAHGLGIRREFPQVLRIGADLGGLHGILVDAKPWRPKLKVKRQWFGAPQRQYPASDQIDELLEACVPVDEDPGVAQYLQSRRLDPADVAKRELALALPRSARGLPQWASWSWVDSGHRLLVPVVDHTATVRNVRAIRLNGGRPKRVVCGTAAGTVMLDALGREAFRTGGWPSDKPSPPMFVITEGETDWLTMATFRPFSAGPPKFAVIGIYSGSWTEAIAARIPSGAQVLSWVDPDPAGDAFHRLIVQSLARRCEVLRARNQ